MNVFSRLIAFCLIFVLVQDPTTLMAARKPQKQSAAAAQTSSVAQTSAAAQTSDMPTGSRSANDPPTGAAQTNDQRVLHALNRLTFGPRPGEVEQVKAVGLDKWIDEQLSPEKIDDSALEARLADYPAMQLSEKELMKRYPSQGMIRAIANGRESMPGDRVERAIYTNQVAYYKQKQAEKAAGKETGAGRQSNNQASNTNAESASGEDQGSSAGSTLQSAAGKGTPMSGADNAMAEDSNSPSMATQESRLYSDLEATQIVNLAPDQRVDRLIGMKPGEFRSFRKSLTQDERMQLGAGLTPAQKEILVALDNPTALVAGEVIQTRLLTDIYSQRQLQAVMTDFWLNHFNVFGRKGPYAAWYLADYQRNVVGPRAMGRFEDLLVATAKSPAMLFYLDNFSSIGPHSQAVTQAAVRAARMNARGMDAPFANKVKDRGLNENYAREVMELHTLGVDGGYTQKDVTELAKVFTGWTIEKPQQGGEFQFDERRHEPDTKHVLGANIKEDGMKEGLKVLHLLATSPATAQFLSKKLAVRFVSDNPPPSLTDRMAQSYLRTGGDIREVLKTMFHSPEFWSKDAYRAKVKTPEEFVISAVRASDGQVVRPQSLVQALNQLGMPFYGMQTPNGYSWKSDPWVNTGDLLARINFSLALASNRMGTITDFTRLLQSGEAQALTSAQKEARLEAALLNGDITPRTRETVLKQLDENPDSAINSATVSGGGAGQKAAFVKRGAGQQYDFAAPIPQPADRQAAMLAGLLLGSPDFQRR